MFLDSSDEVLVLVGELLVFYLSLHCTRTVYAVLPSMLDGTTATSLVGRGVVVVNVKIYGNFFSF